MTVGPREENVYDQPVPLDLCDEQDREILRQAGLLERCADALEQRFDDDPELAQLLLELGRPRRGQHRVTR